MNQHQMRASLASIRSFKLLNNLPFSDTRSLLALGVHHPQTALVIEIYLFQLEALAQLTKHPDLVFIMQNLIENESKLDQVISEINRELISNPMGMIQKRLYYFEMILLISLLILWSSMLIILFTGPIALILGLMVSSAIMTLVSGFLLSKDSNSLFLHQESLKALDQPFFSRTACQNSCEINQTLKSHEKALEHAFYEYSWDYPMAFR